MSQKRSIIDDIEFEPPCIQRKVARFLSRNQARYDSLTRPIHKWRELTCRIANNQPTKTSGGYVQTTYNNDFNTFLQSWGIETRPSGTKSSVLHRVVLTSYKGNPSDKDYQASHLCNNTRCVNHRHLVWESSKMNQSRKNCKRWRISQEGKLYDVCPHEPPCIDTSFMSISDYEDRYNKRTKLSLIK